MTYRIVVRHTARDELATRGIRNPRIARPVPRRGEHAARFSRLFAARSNGLRRLGPTERNGRAKMLMRGGRTKPRVPHGGTRAWPLG